LGPLRQCGFFSRHKCIRVGGIRVDDFLQVVVGIVGEVQVFLQSPLGVFGLFTNPVSFHIVSVLDFVIRLSLISVSFIGEL